MNLNRKAYGVRTSVISSQADRQFDPSAQTWLLPIGYRLLAAVRIGARSWNLGSRRRDDECKSTATVFK
jgi:hypothetical protein